MYSPWLLFFHSPLQEISIQGKKGDILQPVTKEWLPHGGMKLSGSQPSPWSVILQPGSNEPYYRTLFRIQDGKKVMLENMKKAIEVRDQDSFSQADKQYDALREQEKKSLDWYAKEEKKVERLEEKLFTAKQDLYKLRHSQKKKTYLTELRTLEKQINDLTNEKRRLQYELEEHLQNYTFENASLRQSGPVPEPSLKQKKKITPVLEQEGGNSDQTPPESSFKIQVIKLDQENS